MSAPFRILDFNLFKSPPPAPTTLDRHELTTPASRPEEDTKQLARPPGGHTNGAPERHPVPAISYGHYRQRADRLQMRVLRGAVQCTSTGR